MCQLKVIKLDRLEKLGEFRDQYQSLLNSLDRSDTLAFEPDFMAAMNRSFLAPDPGCRAKEIYFLLAFRGEKLIGLAPLVREKKDLTRFGVRRICHYGETNDSLMVSFPQCLAAPHEKSSCIAAFVEYLNDQSHDWDIVDLGYLFLPDEIECYEKNMAGCRVEQDVMKCHAADVRQGFDAYMQSFSPKHRRNFRRSREKLESSHHDVRFVKTAHLTAVQRREIEVLHLRRQQTLRQAGIDRNSLFEVPVQKQAFWEGDEALSKKQLSRHYLLYADNRLIAFQLCYRHRGATYFQLIAMDDDYCQYSPAKLLVLFAYEQEARDGAEEINLLLGTNPLKAQFGKQETVHYRVSWRSPRWSSALRLFFWHQAQTIKAWAANRYPTRRSMAASGPFSVIRSFIS